MSQAEPNRPDTVPAEAVWNAGEGEWELGEKNANGQYVGEWKWWLAPQGHLVCHTFFTDDGKIESFKRFHPNGEVSQASHDESGEFVGKIYYRSTEETSEIFPVPDPTVWKAIQKPGVPVSFDIYDKNGNQLNGFEITEKMKTGYLELEPAAAFAKICAVVEEIATDAPGDWDWIVPSYKPVQIGQVSSDEVAEAEARLGVKLPPSYVAYVTEHGLFKIGEEQREEHRMLAPAKIGRLSDALATEWELDWTTRPAEEKAYVDNIIYFSMGDESLQMVWYICFDLNTQNPETGEAALVNYNQDDWANQGFSQMPINLDAQPYQGPATSMQVHMAKTCKRVIDRISYEME